MSKFLTFFIFISTLAFFVSPDLEAASNIRYTKVYGKRYLYLSDIARYYGMQLTVGTKNCELKSRYSKITFTYDKKDFTFNGLKLHLSYAPFRKGRQVFITEIDFLLLIDPVLRYKAIPKHNIRIIMIDPGHGGKDDGGKGKVYKEKDLVLEIAKKLRDKLRSAGYYVIMTRDRDFFLTLDKRSYEAARQNADLYISIHCNIAGTKSVSGIETFCLSPVGTASTHDSKISYKKEKGNDFDKQNARLGYEIHRSLITNTKAVDRGLKRARFAVLKNAPCPAVLIECGFLSNAYEERKLATTYYQDTLAKSIAEGVIRYHTDIKRK